MKKIISIVAIFTLLMLLIFSGNIYAQKQPINITVETDKTTVRPGETVKVTINFDKQLGAYTFDIKFDNKIFDYQSVEGGDASADTEKVRVVFSDATGGSNPRSNMYVIFKAKEGITTSNPTGFQVSSSGLSNNDTSIEYEDISSIEKQVLVEPEYVPYTIKLEATEEIIIGKEIPMTLSYSSTMGRYYDKARLVVGTVTTPDGATVKLLATDQMRAETDIIQSGWGDEQGFKIGGENVAQALQVRGIFSQVGEYSITLKLIDREKSDETISEQTFKFIAKETSTVQQTPEQENGGETPKEETPDTLPKTGINIYIPIALVLVAVVAIGGLYYTRKNTK